MTTKPLTGRKVFAITASAFTVIIGVNVFMAWNAIRTFPGLEVKNSYVASQSFDAQRAAQQALGWTAEATLDGNELVLSLVTEDGLPAPTISVQAVLGRPTHVRDDIAPEFERVAGSYRTEVDLAPGSWDLRVVALAADGTEFNQRLPLYVRAD